MLSMENDPQAQMVQMMVYYLVDLLGGTVEIDYDKLQHFAYTHMFYVRDIPNGIAFKVTEIMENLDVEES